MSLPGMRMLIIWDQTSKMVRFSLRRLDPEYKANPAA